MSFLHVAVFHLYQLIQKTIVLTQIKSDNTNINTINIKNDR